jgi:acetyltransferase
MVEDVRRLRPSAAIDGVTVEPMVRRPHARELMIGVLHDRVFGPAITIGAGGIAVEVHRDRAVGLPPLNHFLVREMISATRAARMLGEFRGMPPVDGQALETVLLAVSAMVCELPWLREMDINPLLVDESGVIAADARVVVGAAPPEALPYAHMAIHPYPVHLASIWYAPNGTPVTIRAIRPEDAGIEAEFVQRLSPDTKYLRLMGALNELSPAMLARFTQVDYDREIALIAVVNEEHGERQIGVCRYVTNPDGTSCESPSSSRKNGRGGGSAGISWRGSSPSLGRAG